MFLSSPALLRTDAEVKKANELKILEMPDILAWKNIRAQVLSKDGKWFAYRLTPNEGDSELVARSTTGEKEYKFPVGKAPFYSFSGKGQVEFTGDSKWLAFKIYPTDKELIKLKKKKKKAHNKIGLLNLKTGKKQEIEKVKSFSFSNKNPGWIGLHKYAEDSKPGKDKRRGSDLILLELASGKEFNIGNVSEFAFDEEGNWLVWLIDAAGKSGNSIVLRSMKTGRVLSLDSGKYDYKKLNWTEKGDAFAVLKGEEDKDFEDKLYRVIGFKDLHKKSPVKIEYDPQEDKTFPAGMTISPNRAPEWTEDLDAVLFGINKVKEKEKKGDKEKKIKQEKQKDKPADKAEKDKGKEAEKKKEVEEKEKKEPGKTGMKKKKGEDEELAGVVIWHWKDKRLQSQQQKEEMRDKNFSFLSIYRVKEKKFIRLADEKMRQVNPAPRHRCAVGIDETPYKLKGDLDGRRYEDIYAVDLKTGSKKLAVKKCRWIFAPSFTGTHFLYYKDGHFHTYDMVRGKSFNITENLPVSFIDEGNDENVKDPPTYPVGWEKQGKFVLLYDNWDVWKVPVHGGTGTNLTVDGRKNRVRYQRRYRLDPEEKGIDLSKPQYFRMYGEWTKKSGIARIEKGKPGAETLLWDDAAFGGLLKAEKAPLFLYTKQSYKEYADYYAAGPLLRSGKTITDANPQQKEFRWSAGARLVDYTSKQGDKLQAALFLPAGYEEGKSYPTVVYIYEKLSQRLHSYYAPRASGFNKSVYTNRGYAVLMPDITYKINDPGLSSVWCVVPAVEAAVKTGIVDKERVGIQGHSWGGYQTAFLITQTDTFKAAVAGAPLTNMISMYSSIYWNIGIPNQPLLESGQGRFYGGFWDNLDAYTRNSPVYYAHKVNTPLLLLHNDKDGAVDWNQGIEYFNALRQLQKPVVMLQYKGENHGLRKPENRRDYTVRMRQFFDHYLMGKPAPKWYTEGVSHLDHKDHIKELTELQKRKAVGDRSR